MAGVAGSSHLVGDIKQDEKKPEEALDYDERRNGQDYWLASWDLGEVNLIQKNWQAALQYYEKSLDAEMARTIPQLRFDAALCAGKLGEHTKEEKHYRACLDLDPEFPYARNNLGWSLYRQSRLEDALATFDDCILRKVDGSDPKINRARTLERLGRLSEAIEAWKQTGRGGRLSKHAQEQIAKVQARLNRGEAIPEGDDDGEDGSFAGT